MRLAHAASTSIAAFALLTSIAGCGGGELVGGGGGGDLTGTIGSSDGPGTTTADLTRFGSGGDFAGCVDLDGDGYGMGCPKGPDCNDHDPNVNPGHPEVCANGIDDNCNGQTDEMPCVCQTGTFQTCYSGPAGTSNVGLCRTGTKTCGANGMLGACVGEVDPVTEICDGLDNDCDGVIDNGVKNACGTCGPVPSEICGDGIDNNCNGQIDEGCGTCDPNCQCGMNNSCSCHPPTKQPCYDGPPQTLGVGSCHQGIHDCVLMGNMWMWGACTGEQVPAAPVCDGGDHNCDGAVDDGMACMCGAGNAGNVRSCGSNVGTCKKGTQTCMGGAWSGCMGNVDPVPEVCDGLDNDCDGVIDNGVTNACGTCGPVPKEICGDGLDNNCNGQVDEGCTCGGKNNQACYGGPIATRNVGACHDGMQVCMHQEVGESWGPCTGDQKPAAEICGNNIDDNCNGQTDEGCGACASGANRPCGSSVGECKPGMQTCVSQQWGPCTGGVGPTTEVCDGKDNNCNGLTDEGVLNSCGTCPPMPCYTQDYPMPGMCMTTGRNCMGVVPDPNNPNVITLGSTTNQLQPFIYIAVTNKNQVAQINTDTGAKGWQVASYGVYPSRTAVALDGTVWVGNRCLDGARDNDLTCSNMVHLDLNGNLTCRADVPGWVRGVAIDADGYAWAGTYNGHTVWKVDPNVVDKTQNPPRCKIVGSLVLDSTVYGLAVDGRGFLWTSPNGPANNSNKINTKTIQLAGQVSNPSTYGISIDAQNRVWFGNPMHRFDGDPPYARLDAAGTDGIYAVTVHPDGSIWGASYAGSPLGVFKVTLNGAGTAVQSVQRFADPNGARHHGIAVDRNGKIWSPEIELGYADRWNPNGVLEGRYAVDPGNTLYSYSDMTGIQLRTITTKEGHWIQDYDSGYAKVIWDHLEFASTVPNGTSVTVNVRAGDQESDFSGGKATQWCGPFSTSPGAFQPNCPFLNGHRWAQVDVKLSTTTDSVKPSVSDVKVFWSY